MTSQTDKLNQEQLLWARAGLGVVLGMTLFAAIGFSLASIGYPAMSVAGRVGIALFIGFWTGPFFGSVAGIGFHQSKNARRVATSMTGLIPAAVTPIPLTPAPIVRPHAA